MLTGQTHTVTFTAPCWLYSGKGAWYFVTLPAESAAEITYFSKTLNGGKRAGWGSVRVTVQVGKTIWQTSLFPDSKNKSYDRTNHCTSFSNQDNTEGFVCIYCE